MSDTFQNNRTCLGFPETIDNVFSFIFYTELSWHFTKFLDLLKNFWILQCFLNFVRLSRISPTNGMLKPFPDCPTTVSLIFHWVSSSSRHFQKINPSSTNFLNFAIFLSNVLEFSRTFRTFVECSDIFQNSWKSSKVCRISHLCFGILRHAPKFIDFLTRSWISS